MDHIAIKIKKHTIFEYIKYLVMEFRPANDSAADGTTYSNGNLKVEMIDDRDRFAQYSEVFSEGVFSMKLMLKYFERFPGRVEAAVISDDQDRKLGCCIVMFSGAEDVRFAVKNCEAYITDVCILPKFRGRGYVGVLLRSVMSELNRTRGIGSLTLACRENNMSARRAYEKMGFVTTGMRRYLRLCGRNIPQYYL